MKKFSTYDKIGIGLSAACAVYGIGGCIILGANDKKREKNHKEFWTKARIIQKMIHEKVQIVDEFIKLDWEFIQVISDYTDEEVNLYDSQMKYKGIVNSVNYTMKHTKLTKVYKKKLDIIGMKLNGITVFEPNKFKND